MYGAIIGDIVGSPWEFHRIKTKQFPLFGERNGVTDDSIMTVAVADALKNDKDPAETLREWGRRVLPAPHVAGYGQKFWRRPPYSRLTTACSSGSGAWLKIPVGEYCTVGKPSPHKMHRCIPKWFLRDTRICFRYNVGHGIGLSSETL